MDTFDRFMKFANWTEIKRAVNFDDPLVFALFAHIIFNPLAWNCLGRLEYKTKFLSKGVFRGNNKAACLVNGFFIFAIGLTRDYLYNTVISTQPRFVPLENTFKWQYTGLVIDIVAALILDFGVTLVLGAYYQLGIVGTYLGDYFGILLPGKITGFPFNVSTCPMYDGSSMNFLAFAIYNRSIAGFLVTVLVFTCYHVACIFEDSFTKQIYANAAKDAESKKTD